MHAAHTPHNDTDTRNHIPPVPVRTAGCSTCSEGNPQAKEVKQLLLQQAVKLSLPAFAKHLPLYDTLDIERRPQNQFWLFGETGKRGQTFAWVGQKARRTGD